jgi:hypothetical protein
MKDEKDLNSTRKMDQRGKTPDRQKKKRLLSHREGIGTIA